jgi:3-hydroxyacyl-CoA dehydrogenase
MRRAVERVVVLGANGAMGAGSGAVFAGAGIPTTFLARTREKAAAGRARAEKMVKSSAISSLIEVGSLEEDLARAVAEADLVFEAVAEDAETKRALYERVDACRKPDAIVATVSSGLSIAGLCRDRSESFKRSFLGLHFYNPPTVIVGCELVPHAGTDPQVVAFARELLSARLGREVVETRDTPAFAGNRLGFRLLNEVAQLAEEHGVAFLDGLLGPHTGRSMAPLVTIDFVGWDVHKAIVDNLHASTADEARPFFVLPESMGRLIAAGHLGAKTPDRGGFYRDRDGKRQVLDPRRGEYRPLESPALPGFVGQMKALHRVGRYRDAIDVLCEASGPAADLARRVILGYVSYGLGLVGEVVAAPRDVDRIMAFGFNWAPPGLLADLIGPRRTVTLLERARLAVPRALVVAIEERRPIFDEPAIDRGRFFHGQETP